MLPANRDHQIVVGRVADAVRTAGGPALDSAAARKMLAQLRPELDEIARGYDGAASRVWRLPRGLTTAVAIAAVVALVVVARQWRDAGGRRQVARVVATPVTPVTPVTPATPVTPYVINVPQGSHVRAAVGRGYVTVVGPGRLAITSNVDAGYTLSLTSGALIAEIPPAAAPARVVTRTAILSVGASVFLAWDRGARTEVAVSRGAVVYRDAKSGAEVTLRAPHNMNSKLGELLRTYVGARPSDTVDHRRAATSFTPRPRPSHRTMRSRTPAPAATPTPTPAPPTVEEQYQKAEAALAAGDSAEAARLWKRLVARAPTHTLAELALYDLARLAMRQGKSELSLGFLDRLVRSSRDDALVEPASWLRCTLLRKRGDTRAASCTRRFHRRFPNARRDQGDR